MPTKDHIDTQKIAYMLMGQDNKPFPQGKPGLLGGADAGSKAGFGDPAWQGAFLKLTDPPRAIAKTYGNIVRTKQYGLLGSPLGQSAPGLLNGTSPQTNGTAPNARETEQAEAFWKKLVEDFRRYREETRNHPDPTWVWEATAGACDKCQALNGKTFKTHEVPSRPHPNCKCMVRLQGLAYVRVAPREWSKAGTRGLETTTLKRQIEESLDNVLKWYGFKVSTRISRIVALLSEELQYIGEQMLALSKPPSADALKETADEDIDDPLINVLIYLFKYAKNIAPNW